MKFRQVLRLLESNFGEQGFKARDAQSVIQRSIRDSGNFIEDQTMRSTVSTKSISNELRRLYQMGFLKRKRIKRECTTNRGKTCYRGYEYVYSLSSQGRKYLGYLTNQERQTTELRVSLADRLILEDITKKLPNDRWWLEWDIYRTLAENPDLVRSSAIVMAVNLITKLPRGRWEAAWALWKENNIKGTKKERFSKSDVIGNALRMGRDPSTLCFDNSRKHL
jgi:hypothetical protein